MQTIIIDYYESVIREIDINTEMRLKRFAKDIAYCDMLNARRNEMIAIVNQANDETLEFYETTMKDQLKNDEHLKAFEKSSPERVEYLERKLLAKKLVVFLPFLWNDLVIFDFYLKKSQRELLKTICSNKFIWERLDKTHDTFNNDTLNLIVFVDFLIQNDKFEDRNKVGIRFEKKQRDNLKELKLQSIFFEQVECGVFKGYENLEKLHISIDRMGIFLRNSNVNSINPNNKTRSEQFEGFRRLKHQVFLGLINLKCLVLRFNDIYQIYTEAFSGLENLRELNLSNNKIEVLTNQLFSNLKNLKILYLTNNNINQIEPNSFCGLESLKLLDIQNNKLTLLEDRIFSSLANLESLELSKNDICQINSDSFQGLNNLSILNLERNKIEVLTKRIFSYLSNLTRLLLTQNKICQIEPNAFLGLEKLKILDISSNRLLLLDNPGFNTLSNLETLNLSHNEIYQIADDTFLGLNELKILDVSHNKLLKNDLEYISQILKISAHSVVFRDESQVHFPVHLHVFN